jgi:hypothetical protein
MDRRTEIRDFLTSRRARITPEQAGLKVSPLAGARRVANHPRRPAATGSELLAAADVLSRAVRGPVGRIPAPSPTELGYAPPRT